MTHQEEQSPPAPPPPRVVINIAKTRKNSAMASNTTTSGINALLLLLLIIFVSVLSLSSVLLIPSLPRQRSLYYSNYASALSVQKRKVMSIVTVSSTRMMMIHNSHSNHHRLPVRHPHHHLRQSFLSKSVLASSSTTTTSSSSLTTVESSSSFTAGSTKNQSNNNNNNNKYSIQLVEPTTNVTVILVGCTHGSIQSCYDVQTVLLASHNNPPACVVLELCPTRFNMDRMEDPTVLSNLRELSRSRNRTLLSTVNGNYNNNNVEDDNDDDKVDEMVAGVQHQQRKDTTWGIGMMSLGVLLGIVEWSNNENNDNVWRLGRPYESGIEFWTSIWYCVDHGVDIILADQNMENTQQKWNPLGLLVVGYELFTNFITQLVHNVQQENNINDDDNNKNNNIYHSVLLRSIHKAYQDTYGVEVDTLRLAVLGQLPPPRNGQQLLQQQQQVSFLSLWGHITRTPQAWIEWCRTVLVPYALFKPFLFVVVFINLYTEEIMSELLLDRCLYVVVCIMVYSQKFYNEILAPIMEWILQQQPETTAITASISERMINPLKPIVSTFLSWMMDSATPVSSTTATTSMGTDALLTTAAVSMTTTTTATSIASPPQEMFETIISTLSTAAGGGAEWMVTTILPIIVIYHAMVLPNVRVLLRERDEILTRGIRTACRHAAAAETVVAADINNNTNATTAGTCSDDDAPPVVVVAILGMLHVNSIAHRLLLSSSSMTSSSSPTNNKP